MGGGIKFKKKEKNKSIRLTCDPGHEIGTTQ